MPIDASIYSQIQQPKPVNMLADYANVMQLQGAQQANQLNMLKMDKYKRGMEETNALNRIYQGAINPDGTIDRSRLFAAAASSNLGSKIPAMQKAFADQDKALTEADQKKFDLAKNRYGMYQQTLGALAQEPNLSKDMVLQAGQGLVQQGILPADMFQRVSASLPDDPQHLRTRITQGLKSQLTAQQIFEMFAPKATEFSDGQIKGFRDTNPNSPTYGQMTAGAPVQMQTTPGERLSDDRARSEGRLNRDVTMRGQNMVDDRSREANANKPLTDAQAKANLFGTRMQESHRILTSLEGKYSPMAVNSKMNAGDVPVIGGTLGYAGNLMLSEKGQQAEQAQRDFINAVLRRESGAVISPSEFANGQKQYFPQPGDSKPVLEQKRKNRELAIRGLEVEVPNGFRSTPTLTNPGNSGGASGNFGDDPLGIRR